MGLFAKLFGSRTIAAATAVGVATVGGCGGSTAPPTEPLPTFERLFEEGAVFEIGGRTYKVRVQSVGPLVLSTGRIVASDADYLTDREPFVATVPPGEYRVLLSILVASDREYVAAAKAVFQESPVVRWDMAVRLGQNVSELKKKEVFGFGVDAGKAAFMDAAVFRAWEAVDSQMKDEQFDATLTPDGTSFGGAIRIENTNANVVFFFTGTGDGVYASYWGHNKDGRLSALLTDFYLVDWNQ